MIHITEQRIFKTDLILSTAVYSRLIEKNKIDITINEKEFNEFKKNEYKKIKLKYKDEIDHKFKVDYTYKKI